MINDTDSHFIDYDHYQNIGQSGSWWLVEARREYDSPLREIWACKDEHNILIATGNLAEENVFEYIDRTMEEIREWCYQNDLQAPDFWEMK